MLSMEKHLMEKFKEILDKESEITDIKMFYNIEGSWVISYKYNNEEYVLQIDMI